MNGIRRRGAGAAAPTACGGCRRPRLSARHGADATSTVVATPFGDVEYTVSGDGPPVLVLHGSGGGYDQGELLARVALGDGLRAVMPSRFGYLRSTFRDGATFDDQAHAYACLLDHLGLDAVSVVAVSHGGPSALLLAALHPSRVRSLTLLSCGVAASSTPVQAAANRKGAALTALFRHDLAFRLATHAFRRRLLCLMGVDGDVAASLTQRERRDVDRILACMHPASRRAAGVAFDNTAELPGERIAGVRAPTLIVHARDDRLQLYHNAEFAARLIPEARLVTYERGGHLLLAVEQEAIRHLVRGHVLRHDRAARRPGNTRTAVRSCAASPASHTSRSTSAITVTGAASGT